MARNFHGEVSSESAARLRPHEVVATCMARVLLHRGIARVFFPRTVQTSCIVRQSCVVGLFQTYNRSLSMASTAAPVVPVTDDAAVSAVTDGVAAVTVAADASGEASATAGAGTGAGAGAGAGAASGAASDAIAGAATGADADIGADLFQAAHRVLTEPDTDAKAKLTLRAWEMFLDESLPVLVEGGAAAVPEPVTVPGRPSTVEEVPPNQMKGNRTSRKALVHRYIWVLCGRAGVVQAVCCASARAVRTLTTCCGCVPPVSCTQSPTP